MKRKAEDEHFIAVKKFKKNDQPFTEQVPTLLKQSNDVWLKEHKRKNSSKPKNTIKDMIQAWTNGKYFDLDQNELLGFIILFKNLYSLENANVMNNREKQVYDLVKSCFE